MKDEEDGEPYQRVDGKAMCGDCGQHWYDHPRVKKYDIMTGEEMWLVKACDGALLKT